MLGVPTLIVDRNHEIGDNWRNRYHQLVLHDPIHYDQMPYLHFPEWWPLYTPKDKLAGFLQSYAEMLELNVWTGTTVESAHWDGARKRWSVEVRRKHGNGSVETRTLHPRHIVQATGHSGQKNLPRLQGYEGFRGDRICVSNLWSSWLLPFAARVPLVVLGPCFVSGVLARGCSGTGSTPLLFSERLLTLDDVALLRVYGGAAGRAREEGSGDWQL